MCITDAIWISSTRSVEVPDIQLVSVSRSLYVLVGREGDKERNLKGGKLCFRVDRVCACFRKGLGRGDAWA